MKTVQNNGGIAVWEWEPGSGPFDEHDEAPERHRVTWWLHGVKHVVETDDPGMAELAYNTCEHD